MPIEITLLIYTLVMNTKTYFVMASGKEYLLLSQKYLQRKRRELGLMVTQKLLLVLMHSSHLAITLKELTSQVLSILLSQADLLEMTMLLRHVIREALQCASQECVYSITN